MGAFVNIGDAITTISIFNKGILTACDVLETGGSNIDNDLAYMYKIDLDVANKIKQEFSYAHKKFANKVEFYNIGESERINQFEVTDIVMSRIEEILSLAKKEISLLANRKMDYVFH